MTTIKPVSGVLTIELALRRAFSLGQTYWQQADSESYSQNAKSVATFKQFQTLVSEVTARHAETKPVAGVRHNLPPLPSPEYDRCETASGVRLFSEDQMCDFAREHEAAVTTRLAEAAPQPAVQADPAGAGNLPDPGAAHRNAIEESTLEFDAFVNGKTVKWWQQEKFAVALAAFEAGRALAASAGAVKALPGAG